jgi:hypothetical protein
MRRLLSTVSFVIFVGMPASATKTLYIRGVPEGLLRRAKQVAARKGTTLTAVVLDALGDAVGQADDSADVDDAETLGHMAQDMEWYEQNKQRLLKRYRGQYLAIVDQRVVDHDSSFSALARRTFSRFGQRPVFLPQCQPGERTVRVSSPRVVQR